MLCLLSDLADYLQKGNYLGMQIFFFSTEEHGAIYSQFLNIDFSELCPTLIAPWSLVGCAVKWILPGLDGNPNALIAFLWYLWSKINWTKSRVKWTLRGAPRRWTPLEEKSNCWYSNAFHLTFGLFIYGPLLFKLLIRMFREYVWFFLLQWICLPRTKKLNK